MIATRRPVRYLAAKRSRRLNLVFKWHGTCEDTIFLTLSQLSDLIILTSDLCLLRNSNMSLFAGWFTKVRELSQLVASVVMVR